MLIHSNLLWLALVLAAPPTAKELIARRESEQAPVWNDGDVATFFYQGDAEKVDAYFAGQMLSLRRSPGSDVWTRSVRKSQLEKAVFTYAILPVKKERDPAGVRRGFGSIWRGPQAPPEPEVANNLSGTVKSEQFDSRSLGETRGVHVYLPPGHDPEQPCRVVYSTDGKLNAEVLEPLIVARKIPPVIVIAPEAARSPDGAAKPSNSVQKDVRGQEYVPGFNDARFSRHEAFYCRELLGWAEKKYGASGDRRQRIVTGCSYGARFAVEMGVRHPELFGNVFAFSVAGFYMNTIPRFARPAVQVSPPNFFLAAGTWEPAVYPTAKNVAEGLRRQRFPVVFATRVAGHDDAMWREEFVSAIVQAFGGK
jgi:enterochelin esterase-like enzyme